MNLPLELRTCEKCSKNAIGDEFHYIQECDAYEEKRNMLIKKYYFENPSTFKFKILFQARGKELIHLYRFILHISKNL